MTGIAGIIKDYLVSKGLNYTYVNIMPNTPQKCVVVYDVAGRSPEFTFDGAKFRKPSIQITTRDYKYDDSYSLISNVISYLEELEGTMYSNVQFIQVEQTTDIFSYDYQDEYNNMLKCFAVNFNLEIFKQ
jgi:hypothetical protein